MDNSILDKVHKLLRLSQSTNANEAALAAAKAQELIDRHNLSAAMLALDGATPAKGLDDEPIMDFSKAGAPLDARPKMDRWRGMLASVTARMNGCRIYFHGSDIALVGRPSDAETVRYLYGYFTREVERLTTVHGQGMGRTWRNNFRLGVVDTISSKLYEQRRSFEGAVRAEARAADTGTADTGMALMRVDKALATIDQRGKSVDTWVKGNLKLRSGSSSSVRYNGSAREAGRKAGRSIAVGGRRGLASGARKLTA